MCWNFFIWKPNVKLCKAVTESNADDGVHAKSEQT